MRPDLVPVCGDRGARGHGRRQLEGTWLAMLHARVGTVEFYIGLQEDQGCLDGGLAGRGFARRPFPVSIPAF